MPLRSNVEPGTSRWATRRAQWRAEFVAAPGQRLRCTLPRRQSWGLPELEELRGVAEPLAGRGHERRLVVVAQVARRHAQGRAAGAAGFQHDERIGAVSALPDQLPGGSLVGPEACAVPVRPGSRPAASPPAKSRAASQRIRMTMPFVDVIRSIHCGPPPCNPADAALQQRPIRPPPQPSRARAAAPARPSPPPAPALPAPALPAPAHSAWMPRSCTSYASIINTPF